MKRILLSLMVFLMTILVASSLADPMALDDDLTGTFRFPYDDMDPDAGAYVYTYRYPHIAGSDPDASCVNLFFADLLETLETNLQFTAEGYAESGKSVNVDVDYKITCNNSQFFSLVLIRTVTSGEESRVIWQGNTFSRLSAGSGTCDLASILGLSDPGGLDEDRQSRQSEKINQIVRRMVLKQMEENPQGIDWLEDFSADDLNYTFYPADDFYLDKRGNLVFYLEPGIVADESAGYIRFPISLIDIEDEL